MEDLPLLTDGEARALAAFAEASRDGRPPTIREIGDLLGFKSTRWTHVLLSSLVEKGYLLRRAKGHPKFSPTDSGREAAARCSQGKGRYLPLVGRVAAGTGVFAEGNVEGSLEVDRTHLPRGPLFALRVTGDSMTGDAILDGDFVVVREQPEVEPGSIGVVLIEDEAAVKRLYPRPDGLELRSSNPNYQNRVIAYEKEPRVAGKVVGVVRTSVR